MSSYQNSDGFYIDVLFKMYRFDARAKGNTLSEMELQELFAVKLKCVLSKYMEKASQVPLDEYFDYSMGFCKNLENELLK